ncbi:cholesteryl ester transfer protein isoform X2 [Monodelphis domestica]|uniref:cholesteryl ester transfer protein isoform X2 n=1 Tax=Monodelphis domestica TaxID=13616 RepID=UPI0004431221|nr:cholesteryl ester transfer protein isoform X2 [Monodelphis domestica]
MTNHSLLGAQRTMLVVVLFSLALLGTTEACKGHSTSFTQTGIVCRITRPATLVLNQETTKVIQRAFQRATYPDIKGEKIMFLLGKVSYGLHNIQISNLSIASSQVDLKKDKSIDIAIQNVSVIFKGTLQYGYHGGWLLRVQQSVDFEIDTSINLQINTRLTCDGGRVQADTSDCYLSFHKLALHLHGEKQPGWLEQLFTDFISFTMKLILKGQVCKEINVLANIMADFVQKKAALFLTDGDIGLDISLTRAPAIKDNYLESHHKGVLTYKNQSSILPDSTYNPSLLGDSRMLYFWFSDKVLSSLAKAAFLDKRLMLTLTGDEFKALLQDKGLDTNQDILREIFQHSSFSDSQVEVRSLTAPQIICQPEGTTVKSSVSVEIRLLHQDRAPTVAFSFEEDIVTVIQASYEDKKLILDLSDFQIHHKSFHSASTLCKSQESIQEFLKTLTAMVGIPVVISWLEPALTTLLNSKGLDLFDIINPEIITNKGYLVLQMDFGFPQHLLEDFLQTII